MSSVTHSYVAYGIVRFSNGTFDRVREGYKTRRNAERGLASAARENLAEGGDPSATFAVVRYLVGDAVVISDFIHPKVG